MTSPFAKDNLVAWCIVPFDAKKRTPQQRAAMLQELGLKRLAYDWRDEHIPTFDAELDALNAHQIELTAFWCPAGANPTAEAHTRLILDFLRRRQLQTQLWILLGENLFAALDQKARIQLAADTLAPLAQEAADLGCSLALYNHGGWFGQPENQLAIIDHLGQDNVGMVYNLHHGHEHLERLPGLLPQMVSHLLTLCLNGMSPNSEKILPLGQGQFDLDLLKQIDASGYNGPIGILDHRPELDAKISLQQNLDGLEKLIGQLN